MNLNNKKIGLLLTSLSLLAVILLSLSSCSFKNGFVHWGKAGEAERNSGISEFFSTIRSSPGNPDSHYLLARYYQQRGQHREAVAEFKKVISIDQAYVKAYNGLGVSYDLLGDFSSAIVSYEAGVALDSGQAYLHNNLGYSYLMQGKPQQALSAFQTAISLSPRESRFHNNLASAYAENAQYDLALDQFLRGGDKAQAHFNMAEVYFHKGIYAKAKSHYAAALQLDPSKTLARTGGKAADTLGLLFGKTPKSSIPQTGTVIPEPPDIANKNAAEDVSVVAEMKLPLESQVAQPAEEALARRNQEPAHNSIADSNFAGMKEGKNGTGIGDWNDETKMALVQGKAVPIKMEAPVADKKTFVATRKKDIHRNVGIEISNGNGGQRMAQRVGVYLGNNGYPVVRLTNSKPFNKRHTQIYYQEGNKEIAHLVAKQLPTYTRLIEFKKLDGPSIKVKIILGKDILFYSNKFREEARS